MAVWLEAWLRIKRVVSAKFSCGQFLIQSSSVYGTYSDDTQIHWDQASVLVQVGLLDPKFVPKTFKTTEQGKEKEVNRLPVVGGEGARKGVDEEDGKSNELMNGW